MDADSALVPRAELLKQFRISDSSEWRQRNGTADWPPHVVIGKKIYYRKSQIDAWLRNQEAIAQSGHQGLVDRTSAEAMTAVLRQAKVLADGAPPLTAEQTQLVRHLINDGAGVAAK
ncbi:MAG: hypothetical protein ACLQIK_26765 [Mycobacterium sp.]|uniref:hypothetical protein n=2 Tax=Mycobacterium sp. TaxID=1785 RepID=UPI003F94DC3E